MIDWQTLRFEQTWPLWLALPAVCLFAALWYFRRQSIFPDLSLITRTRGRHGIMDRLLPVTGYALLLALIIIMMRPSVVRIERIEQRARDFVILVDTSRSMRHDTDAERGKFALNFRRRVGAFSDAVDDPESLPYVGRFELARESLFGFLTGRRPGDRVALIYFNDEAHPVSALTNNIGFVVEQLATMDDYVNWGTDIADAMDSSLSLLERYPGNNKRTLILMTDAETRYTQDLEQQFARLANAGLSFYLLWITTDTSDLSTEDASNFLDLAEQLGTVVTIKDPDPDNMQNALHEISRLEGYRYEEIRHRTIDLSPGLLQVTRVVFLIWLLLAATFFHPATSRRAFATQVEGIRR
jgi:Mg-chelatase subunit ChlD